MIAVVGVAIGPALYFVLARVVRPDRRRGVVVGACVALFSVAGSYVAPFGVQDAALVTAVIALGFAAVAPRPRANVRSSSRGAAVVQGLTVALFGSLLVATVVAGTSATGYVVKVSVLAVSLVVVGSQFSRGDIQALLDGILFTALLQGACGMVELIRHEPLLWGYRVYDNGQVLLNDNPLFGNTIKRIQGTAGHWIPYGTYLAAGLVTVIGGWARYAVRTRVLTLTLLPLGLVLAGARSALLALIVAVLLYAVTATISNRIRNVLVAVTLAVFVILAVPDIGGQLDEITDTGSYENRAGNIASIPKLLGRPPLETFFGSGFESEKSLFAADLLFNNGFGVIDNQLVTTLATQGILGAVLLIALFVVAAIRTGRVGRSLLVVFVVMLFSFDYFKLPAMICLLFAFVAISPHAMAGLPNQDARASGRDEESRDLTVARPPGDASPRVVRPRRSLR